MSFASVDCDLPDAGDRLTGPESFCAGSGERFGGGKQAARVPSKVIAISKGTPVPMREQAASFSSMSMMLGSDGAVRR